MNDLDPCLTIPLFAGFMGTALLMCAFAMRFFNETDFTGDE